MRFYPIFSNLSNGARVVFLLGLVIFFGSLSIAVAYLITTALYGSWTLQGELSDINVIRIMQIINQIGIFIIPPFLYAILTVNKPIDYLGFKSVNYLKVIATLIIVLSVGPIVNKLMIWNESLNLPESFEGIENWMRESEVAANDLVERMLSFNDPVSLLINLLMIVLIPAIGEELLFRATAIRLMNRIFKNIHVAVWVSAIVFSAFHLQFFGFLPRLFLGLLFGYLFIWSGSIWIPILAHLINNGVVVIVSWLNANGTINQSPSEIGSTDSIFVVLLSVIISVAIAWYFYKTRSVDFKYT